ncbi:MAG: aspartate aminotransferase family protein [Armatimonadota bacterium]
MSHNYDLPGPNSKKILDMQDKYEPSCRSTAAPLVWDEAHGAAITDVDGNEYIDWTSGVLAANIGHSHPHFVKEVQDQVAKCSMPYAFPTEPRAVYAKRIVEKMPEYVDYLDTAFLLSTGSEATEAAMRIAKRYTGKHEVISFWGAFHGRTWGAMSMAGKKETKQHWGPLMPGTIYAPYPYPYRCPFGSQTDEECVDKCIEWLDHKLHYESIGDVAAVITEPYQGGAGFIIPPDGFLKRLEQWAHDNDILFIDDEIQASFGRSGTMFYLEHEELQPDLLCIGKGIANGIPTAALLANHELFDIMDKGEMSSTTGANPVSSAAANAVLDVFEQENLLENCNEVGGYMLGKLQELGEKHECLGDVRGKGLVIGLEFVKSKATKEPAPDYTGEVTERMARKGVTCGKVGIHGNVIRCAPPLCITKAQADESIACLDEVLTEMGDPE